MATSGSVDFNLNRDQIIREAYELLGALNTSDNLESEDLIKGSKTLNLMIKGWEADGVYLWTEVFGTIFFVPGQISYTLGGSSGDHGSDSYVGTTLSATAAAAATSLTVTSTSGMAVDDNIGIELDSGSLFWTTIATIPDSTSLTLDSALTGAAASGNVVYSYTTKIGKPLLITSAVRKDQSDLDRRVDVWAREDYFQIPNKSQAGEVVAIYYQPLLTSGTLKVYLAPNTTKEVLQISYFRSIQDMDNGTDSPDFPSEWLETIIWNLAVRLAPVLGKDQKLINSIKPLADEMYEKLRQWSHDHTYVKMEPSFGC